MRVSRLLKILTLILLIGTTAAYADSITTFSLSGEYENGHSGTYEMTTGTVTIDTTTGVVTAVNLNDPIPGQPYESTFIGYATHAYPFVEISESWGPLESEFVNLLIPTATLVGYSGGSLCSLDYQCADNTYSTGGEIVFNKFTYGALTATPEPPSFSLLAVGALAMMALARVRRFV